MIEKFTGALRRFPWWMWAVLGAWIVVGSALTWRWILSPPADPIHSLSEADAVVLFVGGRGERLETALEIIEDGASSVLVIPNGTTPTWPAANELCSGSASFEVICPDPHPDTTRGEARLIADVARERGWTSLIVVTSTYHLSRAELMLTRCFNGSVTAVKATPHFSTVSWVRTIVHEWFAHLQARVTARGC